MSPVGTIFVPFPPKTGTNMLHPLHPPIVELVCNPSFLCIYEIIQYSSVHFTILPNQAPVPVYLDGTIIDSSTILVTICITVVMLGYDWRLCVVIITSVQYSGGLLPGIILLTQGYYQWGTRLNTM